MRPLFVLAVAVATSGCFTGHQEHRTWGLGLDTSVMPQPAPFSENPGDLNHLFALANASIEALFGRCTTASKDSWVQGQASEWNWNAFHYLIDACDDADTVLLRAEADRAIANGTVAEVASKYQDELETTWERVRKQLDAFPPPGTYADAELQGWLQQEAGTASSGIRVGQQFLEDYYNHTGDPLNEGNLHSALFNLRLGTRALEALEYLIEHYEWQPGVCEIPSTEAVFARNRARFNAAVQRAASLSEPEDSNGISNPYGFLVNNVWPRMEAARRHDWPLLLLFIQPELDFEVAYWENYTRQPLPTLEEGEYLIALHHSKVRSLATEDLWDDQRYWVGAARRNNDWYDGPDYAVIPIALQAVTWPFAELNCHS